MTDMKDMDSLLKATLAPSESPDEMLNTKLKSTLRRENCKEKSISLWWVPMVSSLIISLGAMILVNIYISNHKIGFIINLLILGNAFFNIGITFIGIKFFNLKKGAEIKL